MKLEFLGTGAADFRLERDEHTEGFRRYSSALLDSRILFDPGPHIFHYRDTMEKPHLFDELDFILITHSHRDHLTMDTVRELYRLRPNCQFFGSEAVGSLFAQAGIPFTTMSLGQEVAVGDYLVTPLRGNHVGDVPGEVPYVYSLVDKTGKKMFYGTDTGLLPEHTWIHVQNGEYDLFVLELTIGDYPDAPHLFSHMTLHTFRLMINTMRSRYRPVKEGGLFVTTHMARRWHEPQDRLAEQLAPMGVIPSYDGMIVEV